MRRLVLAPALATVLATAALPLAAQDTVEVIDGLDAPDVPMFAQMIRADDIEDAPIYTIATSTDAAFWDDGSAFGALSAEWEEIDNVEDVILDGEGAVLGVTADVGGFLGIGENEVLLPLEEIRLVAIDDGDDLVVVTRMSRELLENEPEIDDDAFFGDD